MSRSYQVPLPADRTLRAVRQAIVHLSWPIERDDGDVIRVHTETAKSTRLAITVRSTGETSRLEINARLFGFGPWVHRDLGGRLNQLANAVQLSADVPLEPISSR